MKLTLHAKFSLPCIHVRGKAAIRLLSISRFFEQRAIFSCYAVVNKGGHKLLCIQLFDRIAWLSSSVLVHAKLRARAQALHVRTLVPGDASTISFFSQ